MIASVPGLIVPICAGKAAVDHLTFTVGPGQVTGFLGPNGAGKSTTMRLILGLYRPQSGTALINGRRSLACPAAEGATTT